jgi:tryptophanyl-tRNA synthetase
MKQAMKNRIFSGIQPTGNLHLGNYLGAIRHWAGMQDEYECYYCLVDLHAITVPQDPEALRQNKFEMAAALLACGLDPKRCTFFVQSDVRQHSELAWVLFCQTPLGWLNRMTQFKDKAGKNKEKASLGLYGYPVLQAADILLYQATHVPVGEDQKQHIELARDVAGAFNRSVGQEFFTLPEAVIQKEAARIMSLRDGTKKMSKSDPSDMSRINLTDDADAIAQKFKKAKSDMVEGISYDPENRPEASNLVQIMAAVTDRTIAQVVADYADASFSVFKQALADAAVAHLEPVNARYRELLGDRAQVEAALQEGAEKARAVAEETMSEVRALSGF